MIYYEDLIKYHNYINNYFEDFGKDNVKVIIYEDFKRNNIKTLQDIYKFLEFNDSLTQLPCEKNAFELPRFNFFYQMVVQ